MNNNKNKLIVFVVGIIVAVTAVILIIVKSGGNQSQPSQELLPQESFPQQTATKEIFSYDISEISVHSIRGDCWSTINGGVYDLTSWISEHPGGEEMILQICGKDGSALFNSQHGGKEKQAGILAGLKIGVLSQ